MTNTEQKNARHKASSQKLKEKVDEGIARANKDQSVVILLTGNGKGKSTSAFGTVARCVGHGYRAAVVQFIKGQWDCGERNLLQKAGVDFSVMGTDFTWNTQDREGDIKAAQSVWQDAKSYLQNDDYYLVVLDELTYMLSYDYLPENEVIDAIQSRPANQSVIVTGRGGGARLREIADTVSEVKEIKHAYNAGIQARVGIDW